MEVTEEIFVIIPAFNAEKYIENAIKSVIDQTFKNWKLLVIDDCSIDRTYEWALHIASIDTRVKVIKNEVNLGMMANWNKGITFCKAPFFVKLDADDLWHPESLELAMEVIKSDNSIGMVFGQCIDIDEAGNEDPKTVSSLPTFAKNKSFSCVPIVRQGASRMLSYPILRQGCLLMRSELFSKLGFFSSIRSADTEFYFRVGCYYNIHYIDKVLYYYRMHSESDSMKIQVNGKREAYLYEVKNAIFDYYFQHGKLDAKIYKAGKKEIVTDYYKFLTYFFRSQKKYWKMSKYLLFTLSINPTSTIKFYFKRFSNGKAHN